MSLSDEDFEAHMQPIVGEGYALNPPEFSKLAAWNHILAQIHMASHYLDMLRKTDDSTGVRETEVLYRENAYFVAFLTTYAKCFVSAGERLVSLDANKVFKNDSASREAHERIMELRHSYAAHNGASELVRSTVAVKEAADHFVLLHLLTKALPVGDFAAFAKALDAVDAYAVRRMNEHLDKLGAKLGKPILLG